MCSELWYEWMQRIGSGGWEKIKPLLLWIMDARRCWAAPLAVARILKANLSTLTTERYLWLLLVILSSLGHTALHLYIKR